MTSNRNVIIVGAGPVGLLNALGLAQAGIQVTVLEQESAVMASPRAMVYHWSVLDGVNRLGLLEEATRIGFTKQDYAYLVFGTGERIDYSLNVLDGHTPYPYNLHLGQNRLAEIALNRLTEFAHAEVRWNTAFRGLSQDADGVTVEAEGPDGPLTLRADWVVGADGAASPVRKALNLDFPGTTWPERFVATNIRFDFERHGYARSTLMIDPVYGAIIAKIDTTGLWRCTYAENASLPEEGVLDRMPAYFDVVLPGAEGFELDAYRPYRMHQRAAERFRVGRVVLAGDAAHATNPTGGLGLTSGLFDTFVLYDALAAVIRGEAGDEVLDRYAEERRRVFVDIASPAASENKRLIYHSSDPERLESDLSGLRRLATDSDALLERLMLTRRLRTAPLVDLSTKTA